MEYGQGSSRSKNPFMTPLSETQLYTIASSERRGNPLIRVRALLVEEGL
ncbi:hypothetical protein COLO4_02266 [Corchorus olitorius]|uniref:Uncharacterized protein n=1 Tax=Corchorus olitorius TaxID=93759 RepID=A0A1R3KX55_9ROSI|nr:hypothetical protein COLO4_03725 [Corchorus olitorius]OMP12407.1 hypothetical protein COLO4_03247 [Corchorus olitorius]OMP13108.1 hypothetical protein COLO4_02266 [Corchorus olitorius]